MGIIPEPFDADPDALGKSSGEEWRLAAKLRTRLLGSFLARAKISAILGSIDCRRPSVSSTSKRTAARGSSKAVIKIFTTAERWIG